MKKNEHKINFRKARSEYFAASDGSKYHKPNLGFSRYSPAYTITNENIRWVSGLTKDDAKRVLTVAASGDQPMFYALNGATQVDTFDISFCAKVAMDIKSAAIQKLNREEYIKLLSDMYQSSKASEIKQLQNLINDIPEQSAYFLKRMNNYPLFNNGLSPEYYKNILPTEAEYKQLREKIKSPFHFIWTDIETLHFHLTHDYDVINLSNILEYMTPEQINSVLLSLGNHVKPKGYIIAQTGDWGINRNIQTFYDASQKFKDWAKIGTIKQDKERADSEKIAVLQRIR